MKDVKPPFPCLSESLLHYLPGNTLDLYVHLDARYTVLCASHLEVHVPQMILVPEDVREDDVSVPFDDKPHGYTRHVLAPFYGNARIEKGEGSPAHSRHGGGAVGFEDVRDDPDYVGELLLVGNYGFEGALRKGAVPYFPSPGRSPGTSFPTREGGKVVVEHEPFEDLPFRYRLYHLSLIGRSEGYGNERLGLPPGKDGAAVGSFEGMNLYGYGSDLVRFPAVYTYPLVQYLFPHESAFELLEEELYVEVKLLRNLLPFYELFEYLGEPSVPFLLVLKGERFQDPVPALLLQSGDKLLGKVHPLEGDLGNSHLLPQLLLSRYDLLNGGETKVKSLRYKLLGNLPSAPFHHNYGVPCARHNDFELSLLPLLVGGICHELTVYPAHPHAGYGSFEGYPGYVKSG